MAKRRAEESVEASGEVGAVVEDTEATIASDENDGLVEVIASSLSSPGHRRAGQWWPAGVLAKAMLTPKQAEMVRADKRLTVFDPNAKIPSTSEIQASFEEHIAHEANRIGEEQRRTQAVDNIRRRSEPAAGMRDFQDRYKR